jgi:hypothetical protein
LNYRIILSGVRRIQSFLETEYLSPQEALGVANLAVDVLMAYKLEVCAIPTHIQKCLLDYVDFFLSENARYDYISNAISQEHPQPIAAIGVLNDDITENEIDRMFKYSILYGFDHDFSLKNELVNALIFSLNKCNYELSILRLYCIKNALSNWLKRLSEYEEKAIVQAKRHLYAVSKSLDKDKWVWWLKASGLLKE